MRLLAITGSLVFLGLIGVALLFSIGPGRDEQEARVEPDAYARLNAETFVAAEAGDAEAQFRVGRKLLLDAALDGKKGAEALAWLTRAAESGHTGAMIKLAQVFRSGIGAVQNYALAAHWVERAAHAEDPEGMLELGRFCRDGVGFERNPVHAYVWMNRAAAKHNLDAVREREMVTRNLSAEDLKLAQRLSLEPMSKLAAHEKGISSARMD
ncbi:MAG: tetratricopeptide repeat protein [Azoarcus sp.]|nr:tetratricopeptide repeat protein [Azoarcus sp.]